MEDGKRKEERKETKRTYKKGENERERWMKERAKQ
jgi:hypothetical protein